MRLLVELAHEAGLPITAHAHSLAAVEQSVDAGVDCIEHCSCVTEKGSALSEELVASIADRDIAICGVFNPIPQMDLSQAPPGIRKLIAATRWTPERMRERRVDMLHRLHAGGVRIVTGIDAGIGPWVAHGTFTVGSRSSRTQASHRGKLSPRPLRKRPVFVG
jgi:imidazolonepropionase-like amidohydrolase